MHKILIEGARTHNLKNLSLALPRDQLVVITGLSGSGKSSLAFDTLYAEGQRRYVESLSAYARQFLSVMDKPDVDRIEGLSPAIAIEQKATSHNPRSTVGTVTEIHDYLRLLFARAGTPHCPTHGVALNALAVSEMVDRILEQPADKRLMLLAPRVDGRRGEHKEIFAELRSQGFIRVRVDGEVYEIDALPPLDPKREHTIEVVIDRFRVRPDLATRLADSLETCLTLGDGIAKIMDIDDTTATPLILSARYACPECGFSLTELEPRIFSFNNPRGACPTCDGLGVDQFFDPQRVVTQPSLSLAAGAVRGWDRRNPFYSRLVNELAEQHSFSVDTPWEELPETIHNIILTGDQQTEPPFEGVLNIMTRRYRETDSAAVREELAQYLTRRTCPDCQGSRLNAAARAVKVDHLTLPQISAYAIDQALIQLNQLELTGAKATIAHGILQEITQRLQFLADVGLNYLSLDRSADTLSGGEAQRIRLASQIGAGLVGVMYVLDEPSIGLHQRDNERLLATLVHLRDLGNSVIVVEHDEEAIRHADYIVDMGPGAGIAGGHVVAAGDVDTLIATPESLTGDYLAGRKAIAVPQARRMPKKDRGITIRGARGNNLKSIDAFFPAGLLIGVTGVSGSGKSTLINDTLYPAAARALNRATLQPAPCDGIEGLEHFDKVVDIDQSPIGRTPRSNPATYTGLFTPIRELFAGTPEARSRGYGPGRFSFNVSGGRCSACQGEGMLRVEMHFLADVYVPCDVCKGARYNRETLQVRYRGLHIADVLDLTVVDALEVFAAIPVIARKLQTLIDVGLGYLKLGQNAVTLSGGEAQRVKLARELSKRDTGNTLYILDEPTTGLHFHDIAQLLSVIERLRDDGNTIVVIEHNLDVIKTCDWLIDLGPEGGDGGGMILSEGTPEQIAQAAHSHTGRFLAPLLTAADAPPHRAPR
ncbi:excinuclease ABC subunit UvrA [Spiribacter sp. C176]|uniref:UvrABC system protein A n=1 Tax=Spiribacter salilacus TaxID=2664894 RepID=A0A6N7QQ79_9GAMM|nr:excinuclease ABC subunit UvrA [Spiribacter salilacus]MRH78571.1 excinuclease ABC subunit UvrA [Spiribacter salilacus]